MESLKKLFRKPIITAAACLMAMAVFSCIPGMSLIYATDNETGNIHNATKDTMHATLDEAFSNADSGDVLDLTGDIYVETAAAVNKNLTLNLNGYTITSKLSSGSMVNISSGSLTVNGGDGSIVSGQNGARAFYNNGTLSISSTTVSDFSIEDNGGAIYSAGTLTIKNSVFTGNRSTVEYDDSSSSQRQNTGGGALMQYGGSLSIEDCVFKNNKAGECGGAMIVTVSKGIVRNCEISGNTACTGGAIYIWQGSPTFENNVINNNIAVNERYSNQGISRGVYEGKGGGIFVLTISETVTLRDNRITHNKALDKKNNNYAARGGGISTSIYTGALDIDGGLIEGNQAGNMGGGIDYSVHKQRPLILNNALITENSAVRGGGVWLCPQGSLETHSTLGGTILHNNAEGELKSWKTGETLLANGDDINHEGRDSKDIAQTGETANKVKLSHRGAGGVRVEWYEDEADDRDPQGQIIIERYREGHRVLVSKGKVEGYPDLFGVDDPDGTDLSFGIHSEIQSGLIEEAEKASKLIIRNNHAVRGGGIAANSPVIIGVQNEETRTLKAEKKWEDDKILKETVRVDLVRYDTSEDGSPLYDDKGELLNRTVLDRDITLSESNKWSCSFTDLPYIYEDKEGNLHYCDYTIEEASFASFEGTVTESTDGDTKTVTLTNRPLQAVSATKKWKDRGAESARPESLTFILQKYDPEKGPKSGDAAWEEAKLDDGRSSRETVAVAKDGSCSVSWDRLPAGEYRIIEKTDEPAGNGKTLRDVYATEYAKSTVDAEKAVRDAIDEHHRAAGRTKKEDWIATLEQEFRDEYIKAHGLDPEHIYHADEREMNAYVEKKIDAFLLDLLNGEHMTGEIEKATGVKLPVATEDDVKQIENDEDLVHAFTARIGTITVITNSTEPDRPDIPEKEKGTGKKASGTDTGDRGIVEALAVMMLSSAGLIAMIIKRRRAM